MKEKGHIVTRHGTLSMVFILINLNSLKMGMKKLRKGDQKLNDEMRTERDKTEK